MANLPETEDFADGTYQIETSDRVIGGPGGIANKQAQQLGNRTAWLKTQLAKLVDGSIAVGKATVLATSRTLKFKGAVSGSGSYDGGADTEITLTLIDIGIAAGAYPKVTVNAKGLVTAGAALTAGDIPALDWGKITSGKPTTISGFGITDAYTKSQTDTLLLDKAGKATTLAGYGIGDAFTKTETASAVQTAISALVGQAPAALDQLYELAAAMNNDPNFAATMNNQIALKAPLANPTFTGAPTAPTPAAGTNNKLIATTEYVDRATAALDPWALQPIGVPIPVMAGAVEPPTNKAYRYVKLTAADTYNTGVLTGEVVTGVAPLVVAYARISLTGSPVTGNTVYLINTERRSIRPGGAGTLQDDALQNITAAIDGLIPTATEATPTGAISFSTSRYSAGQILTGLGFENLTFDASRVARTSNETRTKNIGANFYMRIL